MACNLSHSMQPKLLFILYQQKALDWYFTSVCGAIRRNLCKPSVLVIGHIQCNIKLDALHDKYAQLVCKLHTAPQKMIYKLRQPLNAAIKKRHAVYLQLRKPAQTAALLSVFLKSLQLLLTCGSNLLTCNAVHLSQ